MKTNLLGKIILLIVAVTFSTFYVQAQTYGKGALGGTGCTATGTNGTCSDTYIGDVAGANQNAAAINNTFIGASAGTSNIYPKDNVALGFQSLYTQSNYGINSTAWSTYNVALGNGALYSNQPSSATNGYKNTATGHNALYGNTTGSNNTALGYWAGYTNSTGTGNTFMGSNAGGSSTTGSYNVYVGLASGGYSTTGSSNTIIGYYAGLGVNGSSTYYNNSFFGYKAGYSCTTGVENVFLGSKINKNLDNSKNSYICLIFIII